jgi:hypothetical protein
MEKEVIYEENVKLFLKELVILLFEKGYFSFPDEAKAYVDCLICYAEQYAGRISGKDAPPYFNRYGSNLKYITYKANKTTSWYILYQQRDNIFLIRHITNNHVAAHYFV